jgi:uncharacterized membrane protein
MRSSSADSQRSVWLRARTGAYAFGEQLWPLPAAAIVVAVALGVGMPELDKRVVDHLPPGWTGYLFDGGPEAARGVLTTVAGSLITVTSLTFSITMVALQLASSQYSPRLLRTFTRDRIVHIALAVLLGTFTYALTVLRTVRTAPDDQAQFVPHLSITIAYLLALASVVFVVVFLAHLAQKIRVESTLRNVHAGSSRTLRRELPERTAGSDRAQHWTAPGGPGQLVGAETSGFLTSIGGKSLVDAAERADAVISVDRLPGDSIIRGTPIATVWARSGEPLDEEVLGSLRESIASAVRTGFDRTTTQDIAFGLRQLTDVAVKALSPSMNDPTTAIHAIGHASALICEAAHRELGPYVLRDNVGEPRVLLRRPEFAGLLELVVSQPLHYAGDAQLMARLLAMLQEVAWVAREPEHRHAVHGQLTRLRNAVDGTDFDQAERTALDTATVAVEGMFVFMLDAAETVSSAGGEVRDLVRVGDRFG